MEYHHQLNITSDPNQATIPEINHIDVGGDQIYSERRELLTITMDLGKGRADNIIVYEGDNPYDLAIAFILRHNLEMKL